MLTVYFWQVDVTDKIKDYEYEEFDGNTSLTIKKMRSVQKWDAIQLQKKGHQENS